jgi:hypothetical protein
MPTIKFCAEPKCTKVAIGAHRSRDYCRPHYLKLVEPHLVTAKVVCSQLGANGEVPGVAGVDGITVRAGGTVRLDPSETNLAALVYSGAIELADEDVEKITAG